MMLPWRFNLSLRIVDVRWNMRSGAGSLATSASPSPPSIPPCWPPCPSPLSPHSSKKLWPFHIASLVVSKPPEPGLPGLPLNFDPDTAPSSTIIPLPTQLYCRFVTGLPTGSHTCLPFSRCSCSRKPSGRTPALLTVKDCLAPRFP